MFWATPGGAALIGAGANMFQSAFGGSDFPSQYKRDRLMDDQKHMMDYQGQKGLELFNHGSYWGRVQQDQNFAQYKDHQGQMFNQQLNQEHARNQALFPDATQFELLGTGNPGGSGGGTGVVGNTQGDQMATQAQQQQAVQMAQIGAQKDIARMQAMSQISQAMVSANASKYASDNSLEGTKYGADAAQPLSRRVLDAAEGAIGNKKDVLLEGANAVGSDLKKVGAAVADTIRDLLNNRRKTGFSTSLNGNLGAKSQELTPFELDEIEHARSEQAQRDLRERQRQLDSYSYGKGRDSMLP